MSSELSPEDQRILERYLSRKNAPVEVAPKVEPVIPTNILEFSVEDIIKNGTICYDNTTKDGTSVGLPMALLKALDYATTGGIVLTMPEIIAAKIKANKTHTFWQDWYSVHTEENIGRDKKGIFYGKNEPVLVVVNGGGILTPERIQKAYADGLINGSAKYEEEEFDNLLEGKLPNKARIKLYNFEDIKSGVSNLPHQFGVVMPYKIAQETSSGFYKKDAFTTNPLVIARAGGVENLEAYYNLAKNSIGNVGNYHLFSGRDAVIPSGRLLYLGSSYTGLIRGNLNDNGRFVGVAPETHGSKK